MGDVKQPRETEVVKEVIFAVGLCLSAGARLNGSIFVYDVVKRMKHLLGISLSLFLCHAPQSYAAKSAARASTAEYVRLIKATRFMESLRDLAPVLAKMSETRGQGSDREFAKAMSVLATADLSDIRDCLVEAYRAQKLTREDVRSLISFFESPLGLKLLAAAPRSMQTSAESGRLQPSSAAGFTDDDRRKLQSIQQTTWYQNYGMLIVAPAFQAATTKCFLESKALKRAGLTPPPAAP